VESWCRAWGRGRVRRNRHNRLRTSHNPSEVEGLCPLAHHSSVILHTTALSSCTPQLCHLAHHRSVILHTTALSSCTPQVCHLAHHSSVILHTTALSSCTPQLCHLAHHISVILSAVRGLARESSHGVERPRPCLPSHLTWKGILTSGMTGLWKRSQTECAAVRAGDCGRAAAHASAHETLRHKMKRLRRARLLCET